MGRLAPLHRQRQRLSGSQQLLGCLGRRLLLPVQASLCRAHSHQYQASTEMPPSLDHTLQGLPEGSKASPQVPCVSGFVPRTRAAQERACSCTMVMASSK